MRALFATAVLVLPSLALAAERAAEYRVEASVWTGGVLSAEHRLLLPEPDDGRFEVESGDAAWRVDIELESPEDSEGADPDAVWFVVGIEQRIDGEWVFLTDTMLGTRLGRSGHVSVVEDSEGDASVAREHAALWIELKAERLTEDLIDR